MIAPDSTHQALRRAAWARIWARLLCEPAADHQTETPPVIDSAGRCRPRGAGDWLQTHDDRVSRPRDNAVIEEDDRRDALTTTDD